MSPLISIITVNYNNANGLQKTIESVISQTYLKIDYIVIDGGSTDHGPEIIQDYKEHLNNWVCEPDSGIYDAMNKGIAIAKGKYLLFLNSGDVFTSSEALLNFITHENFKGDIIYGDYKFEDGQKIYPDELPPDYFMKTSLPHQSTLFKKEVFEQMGLYDETYKLGADRAYYLKCFVSGKIKFQHIPYFLTLFDLSGLSNDPELLEKKNEEDTRMLKNLYGSKYYEYKSQIEQERKIKRAKRNSIKGIVERVINRIKKMRLCL